MKKSVTETMAWRDLEDHAEELRTIHMRELFDGDERRFDNFSNEAVGLFVDYSRNLITEETVSKLLTLANICDLEKFRADMFAGKKINSTEDRSVLHVALRDDVRGKYHVDGEDVMPLIQRERAKMASFCDAIHTGKHVGYTGKPLTTVVNIGIGGSDLGPLMVTEALAPYHVPGRTTHFVSNVDATHLMTVLKHVDPETTLFVIASKTFTTQETMTNAATARAWFLDQGATDSAVRQHFIALSTNREAVEEFGIDHENMFQFWDWVGGRYSLWSAIGLSIALQVGYANFDKLLQGASEMDRHFEDTELRENVPAMLALIGVWNRNFLGINSHAVLPYDQYLHRLAAYLQQADMESNGKSTQRNGEQVELDTGPIIFGEPGTNGQHAFYQLLHQGTDVISADFIAPALSQNPVSDHHRKLLANFLAQPQALMRGKPLQEVKAEMRAAGKSPEEIDKVAPHRVFSGNRPTNSVLIRKLTPETLGALIALYEHKIFCQGIIWGINSFDQWGVELGKVLAQSILPDIGEVGVKKNRNGNHDVSTDGLIDRINTLRESSGA